jgi:hypothetical protein
MFLSTILSGVAIFAVAFEMTWTAAVFGTLALCLVGHGV